MKSITCIHTGMGVLPEMIEKKFGEAVGGAHFHHILDSGLIGDVIEAGGITEGIEARLDALFTAGAGTSPDVMVCTCSSIGEAAERFAAAHPNVNLLRVDYPMAKYAAEHAKKVVVLATLATTVDPSKRLVERLAKEAGHSVEVVGAVAPGAFDAMRSGDMAAATAAVVTTAKECGTDADVILLAQASMANFTAALREALGKETILLESPDTCAEYLKETL